MKMSKYNAEFVESHCARPEPGGQSKSIHAQIFMQRPGIDLTSLTQHPTASNTIKISFRWKGLCLFKSSDTEKPSVLFKYMYLKLVIWRLRCCCLNPRADQTPEFDQILRSQWRVTGLVRPGSLASLDILISASLLDYYTCSSTRADDRLPSAGPAQCSADGWTVPGISRPASLGCETPPRVDLSRYFQN